MLVSPNVADPGMSVHLPQLGPCYILKSGSEWPFDLGRNACLRSLQIEFNDPGDAHLITQILSQISSPHIEEVGLEMRTYGGDEVGPIRME